MTDFVTAGDLRLRVQKAEMELSRLDNGWGSLYRAYHADRSAKDGLYHLKLLVGIEDALYLATEYYLPTTQWCGFCDVDENDVCRVCGAWIP